MNKNPTSLNNAPANSSDRSDSCIAFSSRSCHYFEADNFAVPYHSWALRGVHKIAFSGRWSDATRVTGVRMAPIFSKADDGETQIRSSAKTGNGEGNVRTKAVLPRRVWSQRKERPVGNHSLKSVKTITMRARRSFKMCKSFST